MFTDLETGDAGLAWLNESPTCRLCGNGTLESAFDLGIQAVGSYFPGTADELVPSAPLHLVRCSSCSLVQLSHGCDHLDVYTSGHYGYRSGLNPAMVKHLRAKAGQLTELAELHSGDVVLDIGSNDGTLLSFFGKEFERIGIDPTARQFREHYQPEIEVIPEMFTSEAFLLTAPKRAKLITSLSVLYDLKDPETFAKEVAECLDDDGIWHFEQCYLPTMLEANSYDTICHEHLTYYTIDTARRLLESAGLRIIGVEFNDVNGGSFAVTACKKDAWPQRDIAHSDPLDDANTAPPLTAFFHRSMRLREELIRLVDTLNFLGDTVGAIGASTKGNTLLQFCGFGPSQITAIGEVNHDKIGRFTPGSHIPIVAERDVIHDCDYLLVLPWHFREGITKRLHGFLDRGGRLIFPLPEIEVVTKKKEIGNLVP